MRAAVLIIGSLFWRRTTSRINWRRTNLDMSRRDYVQVPIRYRRLSGADTYTMGFAARGFGTAMVVPCKQPITNFASLEQEAKALWAAEAPSGIISLHWGSVAVLFGRGLKKSTMAKDWTAFFQKSHVQPSGKNPITREGCLKIPWPKNARGRPVDFDILLATSNVVHNPSAKQVAQAWVVHGNEEYFFRTVAAGISTPLDNRIWGHLVGQKAWGRRYPTAVKILKRAAGKK
jgi:hypothetical protein